MIPATGPNGVPGTHRRTQEAIDTLGRPSSRPNASPNPTEGRLMQDHLLSPLVTAHCFWWPSCKHTVTDRPQAAHDAMESHYADTPKHQAWLRREGF